VSKRYFIFGFNRGDNWEEHAWKVHQEGVDREGADQMPSEAQVVGKRVRVHTPGAAIGLDTQDVHMGGDRVVVVAENPDRRTGDVDVTVERYSDSGRFLGTYRSTWERDGRGRQILSRTRRVFY